MELEDLKEKNEVKNEEEKNSSADTQTATTPSENEGQSQPELSENTDAVEGEETNNGVNETQTQEPSVESESSATSLFTPEQQTFINKLVGSAREEGRKSAISEIIKEYGLDSIDNLSDIIGKSQQFDYVNGEYENANKELEDYHNRDMFTNANIISDKFDDVKAILKYKGLPITQENITNEVSSHPEWIKVNDNAEKENNLHEDDKLKKAVQKSKEELFKSDEETPSVITSTTNDTTSDKPKTDELAEVRAMYNLK